MQSDIKHTAVASALEAAGINTPTLTPNQVDVAISQRRRRFTAGVFSAGLMPMEGVAICRADEEGKIVAPVAVAWRIRMSEQQRLAVITPTMLASGVGDSITSLESYHRIAVDLTKDENACAMFEVNTPNGKWVAVSCSRFGPTADFITSIAPLRDDWSRDVDAEGSISTSGIPLAAEAIDVETVVKHMYNGCSAWGLFGEMMKLSGGQPDGILPHQLEDKPCEETQKVILVHKIHPPETAITGLLDKPVEVLRQALDVVEANKRRRR